MLGGELLTGMTVDGAINGRGEDTVGGVLNDLLQLCRDMGGFVAKLNDWRLIQYVAYDPEIMKIAIPQLVFGAGVTVHLQTFAEETVQNGGRLSGLVVRNKGGPAAPDGARFRRRLGRRRLMRDGRGRDAERGPRRETPADVDDVPYGQCGYGRASDLCA